MSREISIKAKHDQATLAKGVETQSVFRLEGNWYFDQSVVDMHNLQVTDRTYVCPHKGTCFWIDLVTDKGVVADVAWVYTIVKANYEHIKDKIAFYGGNRHATAEA